MDSEDTARTSWRNRLRIDRTVVPTASVVAVAIASVTTAVMMSRPQMTERNPRPQAGVSLNPPVVKAPPLVVRAPPLRAPATLAQARTQADGRSPSTRVAGAGAGCGNCGVVESVTSNRPSTYQLRVRMDDGSVKLVEQRGAFPAGSRVVLEAGTLRAAPENG